MPKEHYLGNIKGPKGDKGDTGAQGTKGDKGDTGAPGADYQPPAGGIPKSDLAAAVQTSLNKADTALQSETDTVPAWAKSASKPAYTAGDVGAEPAFSKNGAFNKNFGAAAGTVCEGNDSRLSNVREPTAHTHTKSHITDFPASMPASDVSAWAKAAAKPSYTSGEVGAEPAFSKNTAFNKNFGAGTGTVCEGNDSRLSDARPPAAHSHGNADLSGIAAWAKTAAKPTYTASEAGAEPAFIKNTAFNKNFGAAAGAVCEGNDSRLSNARPPTAHTHYAGDIYGLNGDETYEGGGSGTDYAFIQMMFYSEELGIEFILECDLFLPSLAQLAENFGFDRDFFEIIADNGFLVEGEEESQAVEMLFMVIAGLGGRTSVTIIEDGMCITAPLTCIVAIGKGIMPISFSAKIFGEEIDLIEFLGDAEHTGTYVTPNTGGIYLAAMLGLI